MVHPELVAALQVLVDPATRGDPESPLRWTHKSTHTLSAEMFTRFQLRVGDKTVGRLLRELGYSLQAPSKSVEGKQHPDRNAQFEHLNGRAETCLARGIPFISVDTKKKELVGNFKNSGREWHLEGAPLPARHQQVEQGRAPPVLLHLDQLARPAATHLRDGRESDRQHNQWRRSRR